MVVLAANTRDKDADIILTDRVAKDTDAAVRLPWLTGGSCGVGHIRGATAGPRALTVARDDRHLAAQQAQEWDPKAFTVHSELIPA